MWTLARARGSSPSEKSAARFTEHVSVSSVLVLFFFTTNGNGDVNLSARRRENARNLASKRRGKVDRLLATTRFNNQKSMHASSAIPRTVAEEEFRFPCSLSTTERQFI